MSTSSNKRKPIGEFSNGEGAERPPPALRKGAALAATQDQHHLPAPVWGHVLEYMPYEEVRSALLICKMFANDAVKYVHTLNIMKPCQLVGPPARRFPNVEGVNCLCLVYGSAARLMVRTSNLTLCVETSARLVPFLTIFPRLKRVFAGGLVQYRWGTQRTNVYECKNPPNYPEIFGALVFSFLGAYKTRLLPSTMVSVGGITESLACVRELFPGLCRGHYEGDDEQRRERRNACPNYEEDLLIRRPQDREKHLCPECSGGPCSFCQEVSMYFPLKEMYEMAKKRGFCSCADNFATLALLAKRKGAKKVFDDDASFQFVSVVAEIGYYFDSNDPSDPKGGFGKDKDKVEDLLWRLQKSGVDMSEAFRVVHLTEDFPALDIIDKSISLGFDPKLVAKEGLYQRMYINGENRIYAVFEKPTLDALIARGFPFDPNDLIVIDAKDVALLQKHFNYSW